MNSRYTIAALTDLLTVLRDSERALRACAAAARGDLLSPLCARAARQRAGAARELARTVWGLGGVVPGCSRSGGPWSDRWSALGQALACAREGEILEALERGESRTLEAYRNALDDYLPEGVREVVTRQFEEAMYTHDEIRHCRLPAPLRPEGGSPGVQAPSP